MRKPPRQAREEGSGEGVVLLVRALPRAKRDEIVGVVGGRVKVRIVAAPEGGEANRAICRLIARVAGVRVRDVEVISGRSSREKRVRVRGVCGEELRARLGVGPS